MHQNVAKALSRQADTGGGSVGKTGKVEAFIIPLMVMQLELVSPAQEDWYVRSAV
jgi:hypothetical protein